MTTRVHRRLAVVAEQAVEVVRWAVLATVVGVVVAVVIVGFMTAVHAVWEGVQALAWWAPFAVPVAVALLLGLTVYRVRPTARGAGTPDYVQALNNRQGHIPFSLVVAKVFASVATLGSGLSGGFVGPGTVIGGGIGARIGRWLRWLFPRTTRGRRDVRLATTCGCAAALATILHAPLGAAVFAVEVLFPASIHYEFYFPAALAGAVGYLTAGMLAGWSTLVDAPPLTLDWSVAVPVLVTTLLVTVLGLGFVWLYQGTHAIAYRWRRRPWVAPVAGAVVFVGVALVAGTWVFSTGEWHVQTAVAGPVALSLGAAAALCFGKAVATAVTVGSGNSGGLTGPLIMIGAAAGAVVAGVLGVADPAVRAAACAAGIAGALAAVLNVPIAAALIVTELFGISYVIPALAGSVLAYKMAKPVFAYEYVALGPVVRRRPRRTPTEKE